MARRHRILAARRRAALLAALGGRCAHCGETSNLHFDHINPDLKTYETRTTSIDRRLVLYIKEAAAGNIQILCERCNDRKGTKPPTHHRKPHFAAHHLDGLHPTKPTKPL